MKGIGMWATMPFINMNRSNWQIKGGSISALISALNDKKKVSFKYSTKLTLLYLRNETHYMIYSLQKMYELCLLLLLQLINFWLNTGIDFNLENMRCYLYIIDRQIELYYLFVCINNSFHFPLFSFKREVVVLLIMLYHFLAVLPRLSMCVLMSNADHLYTK